MKWLLKQSFLVSMGFGLFLAQNFYMLFIIYKTPELRSLPLALEFMLRGYFVLTPFFFTIGFVVSAFFLLTIGWPLYWLANKYSFVNYFSCALGGGFVVIIPYILCLFFGWEVPEVSSIAGVLLLLSLLLCGSLSGIVFNFLRKNYS